MELLKELCECPGIPGREERLRAMVRRELEGVVDEWQVDALGNLIGRKRPRGRRKRPRLMIATHTDEIGFLVSYIEDKGFLRVVPVGGHDPRNMVAQRVLVQGVRELPGVLYPGIKPTHLLTEEERKKVPQMTDFFVDVGLPVEQVRDLVPIGSAVTLQRDFAEIGDTVCCKALDDRLAVYILVRAMQQAQTFAFETFAVATSQEEVGLRGAMVSAYGLEPDVGIAVDVTIAADIPGVPDHEQVTRLGQGAAIKLMDSYSISHPKLVEFLEDLAKRREIPYQREILPRGGTDAGAIQRARAGCPAATLSTPTRYVHTSVEMAHRSDIQATIDLLAAFIEEGDRADLTLA